MRTMDQTHEWAWTTDQAIKAVTDFLQSEEGSRFQQLYRDHCTTQSDQKAFVLDAQRRLESDLSMAREWWETIEGTVTGDQSQLIAILEPLAQHGAHLDDLFRALPAEFEETALTSATQRVGSRASAGGPPPGITNTRGWSDDKIYALLETTKANLEWDQTTDSARKFWTAFEEENDHRPALVLRLAEELQKRKTTISEFFLAYVYSNTENIQANLHYLDYSRRKKERALRVKTANEIARKDGTDAVVPAFRFPPLDPIAPNGITNTRGWSVEEVMELVHKGKSQLDWENATGGARKWWVDFEQEWQEDPDTILRLVEELQKRKATATEFFLAYVYSNTDDLLAVLNYLDYTRLKKEEQTKKEALRKNREQGKDDEKGSALDMAKTEPRASVKASSSPVPAARDSLYVWSQNSRLVHTKSCPVARRIQEKNRRSGKTPPSGSERHDCLQRQQATGASSDDDCHITEVGDADFQRALEAAATPVLVEFWAPWCGPCKSIRPILEDLARRHLGVLRVVAMNVDENPITPSKYNIRGIPNLVFLRDNEVAEQIVGAVSAEQLEAAAAKILEEN